MSESRPMELYGWRLLYRLIEDDIQKKTDVLMAFVHWALTKAGFVCLGNGDDKTYKEDEKGDELLPKDWNRSEVYTLRYVRDKVIYIVKGITTDEDLIVNFLRASDLDILVCTLNIDEEVKELRGPIEDILPRHRGILRRVQDTVESFKGGKLDRPPHPRPKSQEEKFKLEHMIPHQREVNRPLFEVGGADLNPLSGGGGMLYHPFENRPSMNPPQFGRIPGARFDPLGPPGVNLPRPRPGPGPRGLGGMGPDPDHLPPPGYDDMFM